MSSTKHQTRVDNLECASKRHMLMDRHGCLIRDWIELAGSGAPTMQLLLDRKALPSSTGAKFIGIDTDEDTLAEAKERYSKHADSADWVRGKLESILAADQNAFPNAGVLVFDSWNAAQGQEIERTLPILFDFARRRERQHGEFMLVLNVSLKFVPRGADTYRSMVESLFGARIPAAAWTTYRSSVKSKPMLLTRLRFGC
jgi:SAM-dependent methyltransferase